MFHYYMSDKEDTRRFIQGILEDTIRILAAVGISQGYHQEPRPFNRPSNPDDQLGIHKITVYEAIKMVEQRTPIEQRRQVCPNDNFGQHLNEAAICAIIKTINASMDYSKLDKAERRIFIQRWNRSQMNEEDIINVIKRAAYLEKDLAEIFCRLVEETER